MIFAVRAPAFLTVQDAGFRGQRSSGIPPCGAMDRTAWLRGNVIVGNRGDEASLEWAVSGGALRFETASKIALTGARVSATLDGIAVPNDSCVDVSAGAELVVSSFDDGRFLYVAVASGIDVPVVLGSRSTYLPGKFGGFGGRRIRTGDRLPIGTSDNRSSPGRRTAAWPLRQRVPGGHQTIHVVSGPEESNFELTVIGSFYQSEFAISSSSDRVGCRLDGPVVTPESVGTMISQPSCIGAIQVPPGGSPIVLMADGPTIGGYPRIAVVTTADFGMLAQMPPGAKLRFVNVELAEAVSLLQGGAAPA